jgi:hypothetical protein
MAADRVPPRQSARAPWLLGLASVCGLAAGWFAAARAVPEPGPGEMQLHTLDFHLGRPANDPLVVDPADWVRLPWLFGDFDLQCDVELGDATDLDLVVRVAEPRQVQGLQLPFHGRFSVLRLSTRAEAPAWRSRDEALFGPRDGGALLGAGLPATVWIEARGRQLRANVAGRRLPWFEAADQIGSLALVAHGGRCVVRKFDVKNLGAAPGFWSARGAGFVLLGLGLALGMLAVGRVLGAGGGATAGALVVFPAVVSLLAGFIATGEPLLETDDRSRHAALAAAVPAALLLAARSWRSFALTVLLAGAASWFVLEARAMERARLGAVDRLDAVFGAAAGDGVLEAHGRRIRGRLALYGLAAATPRVLLLGGQLLYDRASPTDHLEPLLLGELRKAGHRQAEVICLPTADGWSGQQWRLFDAFFRDYAPRVLVFGVPRDETAADPRTGQARSDAGALREVLQLAVRDAETAGRPLVFLLDAELPPELGAVVRAVAAARPVVAIEPGEAPPAIARRLGAAIEPLLAK